MVKPTPCARLECWCDPEALPAAKSLKAIGARLQAQYEFWHEKARYRLLLDPTADEVRKMCLSLRRAALDDRILFHYNGHGGKWIGQPRSCVDAVVFNRFICSPFVVCCMLSKRYCCTVPKPTNNGEIWVFNKGYTQYIPVSLYDLQVTLSNNLIAAPSFHYFVFSFTALCRHLKHCCCYCVSATWIDLVIPI